MKKLIVLAAIMVVALGGASVLTGCGKSEAPETGTVPETNAPATNPPATP